MASAILQEDLSVESVFNVVETETLASFEHLSFEFYGIRPVERELQNTVVRSSCGFDRPPSRDASCLAVEWYCWAWQVVVRCPGRAPNPRSPHDPGSRPTSLAGMPGLPQKPYECGAMSS